MRVEAVLAYPDRALRTMLDLPTGATVADACALLARTEPFAEVDVTAHPCGVFGERCGGTRVLEDGDRLELYRPLEADPKERRRAMALAQRESRG